MASTNKTSNYGLPQFLGTDKASWLGDINPAMLKIDSQMKLNETSSAQAVSTANSASSVANGASTVANNAFNLADGNAIKVPVTVTTVSGSPVQTLPICSRNANNTLINIILKSALTKINLTTGTAIFKFNINPATQRTIGAAITLQVFTVDGRVDVYFTDLLIDPNGTCRVGSGIDLSGANVQNIGIYINSIYSTYGWYA